MELPNRKPTRLKNFDYSTEGAYFITICTHNREKILCDIVGGGLTAPYLSVLRTSPLHRRGVFLDAPKNTELLPCGKIVEKYINKLNEFYCEINVDKYVIMPNHIHILLFVSENGASRTSPPTKQHSPVSQFISTLKRFVNKEIGHNIFQRSFHDHIIRDENDYLKIWNYIDTNPHKWESDCFYVKE